MIHVRFVSKLEIFPTLAEFAAERVCTDCVPFLVSGKSGKRLEMDGNSWKWLEMVW